MSIFSFLSKSEEDLTGTEFKSKFQSSKNAKLLDVRTPAEFASGKIPGAKNINIQDPSFQSEINKLSKDTEYYVYCRSGMRSSKAVKYMNSMGFKAYNLQGGIGAWPN
jgi:rhodanese-related sulfurtransferase